MAAAAFGIVFGCGSGTQGAPPTVAPVEPEAAAGSEGRDVHLGCDVVAWTAVEAEARRLAEARGGMPEGEAARALLAQTQERLVREAIARREARRLMIEVMPDEIDRAVEALMRANGMDEAMFGQLLTERGMTMEELRADAAQQILEFKVVLARTPLQATRVTDEEVRAEYERQASAPGAALPSFEEARDAVRDGLINARMLEAIEAFYARMREVLEAVPTRTEEDRCVEEWPEYAAEDLRFVGQTGTPEMELRAAVREALGEAATMTIDIELPTIVRTLILAACMDHGYLDAEVELEELGPEQATVRIREGEVYRLGTVRVVTRDGGGTESDVETDGASWRPLLALQTGDVFVRRTFGEFLAALQVHLARAWGIEPGKIIVLPELNRHDLVVDPTVVVERTDAPPAETSASPATPSTP
jgi:hypothetical protein